MMMVANAVITGHHCGSFQSVQKSQSPANNCLVMSAAPATTKIAVIQKTKSHLPSIHLYFFCNRARSSSRRCASANAAGVVAAAITLSPDPALRPRSVCYGLRPRRRYGVRFFFRLFDFEQAQYSFAPHGEHPRGQPSVGDEWPVERHCEKFLGNPEAVPPFVERDFHTLENRGGDQQKE